MYSPRLRWILVVVSLALAVVTWLHPLPGLSPPLERDWRLGSILLAVSAVSLAWGHFRYGPVWLAWRALHRGDDGRARSLIASMTRPHLLAPSMRAYRDYMLGLFALEDGETATALQWLDAVDEAFLRTDHIRSVLRAHRALAHARLGDRERALELLADARTLPHRPEADALVSVVERELGPATA